MIVFFFWHLFLAVVWAFALGDLTAPSLAIGLTLAYVFLWIGRGILGSGRYCSYLPRLIEFILFFLWELILANLRVAYDVLTRTHHMRPGIIALPLDAKTDGQITLLANLITLTPGTLSLDVSSDRKFLFIHSMYIRDIEHEKRRLKHGFERRLLEMMR